MSRSTARSWRYPLIILAILIGALLSVLTLLTLAIYTETGSRRVTQALITRLNQLDDVQLRSSSINGNLLSGLTLTDLEIDLPSVNIAADSMQTHWNPYSLFTGSFYLSALDITNLRITPAPTETETNTTDVISLLRIDPLPINLAVGALKISDLNIIMPSQQFTVDSLALRASLSGRDLTIQSLHVVKSAAMADLSLQAQLTENIPIAASVNWEYQGELLANYNLAVGRAAITGDLTRLNIQHELLAPEAIHSSGTILNPLTPNAPGLSFTHHMDTLRLPVDSLSNYLFEDVSLDTNFNGAVLDLSLQSNMTGAELPPIRLAATAALEGSTLRLASADIRSDSGSVRLSGSVDWASSLQSTLRFNVTEQAPLQYLSTSWPVEISDVTADGTVTVATGDSGRRIDVNIANFAGISNDNEILGQADFALVNNALQIQNLQLNTNANSVTVTGEYQDQIHLKWQLDAPALEQLLGDTSGAAQGQGEINGDLANPVISASLQLHNLQRGTVTVNKVDISANGALDQLQGSLILEDLAMESDADIKPVDRLQIDVSGSLDSHTIDTSLQSPYGSADFSLAGNFDNSSAMTWHGTLNKGSLQSDLGNWESSGAPAAIVLSASSAQLSESCWRMQDTELCLELTPTAAQKVQVAAELRRFPLQEFNSLENATTPQIVHSLFPHLPNGLSLDGMASASLTGEVDLTAGIPELNFELSADNTVLSIASTETIDPAITEELQQVEDQHYNWDTVSVRGNLGGGTWSLSGAAALSQQNIDGTNLGLHGEIQSNLVIEANDDIQGAITSSFAELGWVQAFLPEVSNVSGSLTSEIDISGTLSAPLFGGDITVQDGSAELSRFGIALSDIQTTVAAQTPGSVQVTGSVNSGNGNLAFGGEITDIYTANPKLTANLRGKNFQLANIPDITLEASPDLTLTANNDQIFVNGSLDLPLLDLTLRELPSSAVDISRDAVVVSYPPDQPELARSIAASQNTLFDIPLTADINLTLGDSVKVSGFGMDATLDGNLSIQQRSDGHNLTYGELSIVQGSYSVYGQTLDLRQGKLLFFGAIDNPALDIRAVREVDNMTVGVLMNGTLKNIRSQLFSTPVLPDNDIISVLVTGRPYSELGEQDDNAVLGAVASLGLDRGEGLTDQIRNSLGLDTLGINSTGNINSSVLTIGKYLTPDIFMRYGVGLFDHQSKVAVDYNLTDRIMLQAESGEYQSLDLTYTVER